MLLEKVISRATARVSFSDIDEKLLYILKRNILGSCAGICASLRDKSILQKFELLASEPAPGSDVAVWGIEKQAGISDALFMNSIMGQPVSEP
ncbi:MAG: hypothetical protein KAS73_07150 [Candidatus Sabulitectum sp.]|nr:hypothetical protein [Candidatus Sabulitectum sp.]